MRGRCDLLNHLQVSKHVGAVKSKKLAHMFLSAKAIANKLVQFNFSACMIYFKIVV